MSTKLKISSALSVMLMAAFALLGPHGARPSHVADGGASMFAARASLD